MCLPLAQAEMRYVQALRGPLVKCLVVDRDNTLWGGVIGEDGPAGIELGESGPGRNFRDLQQDLSDLRRRGILLAICRTRKRMSLKCFTSTPTEY